MNSSTSNELRRAACELRRADAIASKSAKIDRHKVIGKAAASNLSVILSALDSLSAPQPPAEAQPVDGLRVVTLSDAWDYAHGELSWSDLEARAVRHQKAHPPPSAPVGVEEFESRLRGRYGPFTAQPGERYVDADIALAVLREALAQQPAAAGEEIMVNAAHDVYTLPLQPSGLSSGPRFVVHVPEPEQQPAAPVLAKHQPCGCVICTFLREHGSSCEDEQQCQGCGAKHCGNRADHPPYVGQQPAAEDEAMVERAARAWCAGTDTPFDQLPDAGKARCLEDMRVVLTAALAAQPGGSDNDR